MHVVCSSLAQDIQDTPGDPHPVALFMAKTRRFWAAVKSDPRKVYALYPGSGVSF
jgi:hypothetical protein